MKEYFESIVKPMVDYPDEIIVEEVISSGDVLLKVDANKNDIGKLIGRNGNNAHALRTICTAVAAKRKMKFLLELPH